METIAMYITFGLIYFVVGFLFASLYVASVVSIFDTKKDRFFILIKFFFMWAFFPILFPLWLLYHFFDT